MAGLKELRTRIESIKSTQKITSAMKMVAAARLRRAQDMLVKSLPYHEGLLTTAGRIIKDFKDEEERLGVKHIMPQMMTPHARNSSYLLIAFTSDRGLCGSYNAFVVKETVRRIEELKREGKDVKLMCVGKKVSDALKHRYADIITDTFAGVAAKGANYEEIEHIIEPVLGLYYIGEYDVCEFIYTRFHSAINREVVTQQFLPYSIDVEENPERYSDKAGNVYYEYDAPKQKVLADLMPMLAVSEAFQVLINSQAAEHGARMTSMDNATRNAKDMISKLTLKYNRIRQTAITTELTEIISGAEAL